MPEKIGEQSYTQRRLLYLAVALVGLGGAMWLFSDILIYITISLILAAILKTPTNYLSQWQIYGVRMPRAMAISISFLILSGILVLFVYLFVPLISAQIRVITDINYEALVEKIYVPLENVEDFLLRNKLVAEKKGFVKADMISAITETFQRFQVTSIINNIISITGNFFIGLLAVLFITFFFLYEKGTIRKYLISLIPNKYFEVSIAAVSKTESLLSNYLLGLSVQMIIVFSIVVTGLLLLGIEYAITIAIVAAIANTIPFLGPIIGAVFGLFVALSTAPDTLSSINDYMSLTAKVLSVFVVVQVTDNLVLQPVIFSKSVQAHPLAIFLIVFVGAAIAGPVGMIFAIPVFTILRVTFGEFYRGYRQYHIFK